MFNIGLSEILVIALVSIVVLDKNQMPAFIDLIRNIYRYFMIAKSRTRKLLKDAGIEDLYKKYSVEKVNYIVGKDGKFYASYNIDNTSKGNDSKDSGSR
ncbi:Sec-independent protein translocase subunit TatB [Wolbachia endosymbiont of Tettigetta isshikii]|uniref:Sec-independent protein translocase subunit TatB n=1 Tax=Wolbachia endosymbiont of Tettigetta isshikii TaxID=3239093 RepID=UPI00397F9E52